MASPKENSSHGDSALIETQLDDTSVAPVPENSALADTAAAPSSEGALDAESLVPAQTNTIIKHYEVIRKLGEGGMGAVYLARDTRLGRRVAIKFLHEQSGPASERFLVEARATALCQHENIVVIYDVGEFDGYPYMVLEYIEGRTLRAASEERLSIEKTPATFWAIELMIPVVRALCAAHAMNIVHRDLKPENILLSNRGLVKVVDFGIAKQVGAPLVATMNEAQIEKLSQFELTQHGTSPGTMMYMSPEQWLAEDIDVRTDIWAAGLILYELLIGEHPLAPVTMTALKQVVQFDTPMPSAKAKRPDAAALGEIIDRCLQKRKEDRYASADELRAALEALSTDQRMPTLTEEECPFAGLSAFQEADAARYFGREQDIAAVVGKLRHQELMTIAGPSGAGKSSFVRAGVIPAMKSAGRHLETCVIRPGRRPLAALVDALSFLVDTTGDEERIDAAAIEEKLLEQPGYLGVRLRGRCRRRGRDHRILLFVDQFEELYTLGSDPQVREAFCASLLGVADDASSPLRVILSIRADFLDRLADDRTFLSEVTRGLYFLPPMSTEGLRDAFIKPLDKARYSIEDDSLVDEILAGLVGMKSPLPILQFLAAKLWETRDKEKRLLTTEAYRALGGVAGALSTHADAVLTAMSPVEQKITRAVFMRLVTPERTRAIVLFEELCELSEDRTAVEQAVQRLAEARLVSIEAGDEREGNTVELVHESLIERWGKLRQWLEETEHDAQFLAELRNAASQWEKNGEAAGLLWRDQAAQRAGNWYAQRGTSALGKREQRYIEAVIGLAERTKRRTRRIVAALFAAISAVAVVVSVLAINARAEARRADEQTALVKGEKSRADEKARQAEEEARQARNASRMASAREHLSDPTLVLALVREMEPTSELPPRWRELALWAKHQGLARVVLHHQDIVNSASFSPDGTRILIASWDKTAQVWNADGTGKPRVLEGHQDNVYSASFSADGTRIVTASSDKTARLWNADGTGKPRVLEGHQGRVTSATFSADGTRIVTASWDKTARVWNADGTGKPRVLEGHQDNVHSASFSPDGTRIVTASFDKTARVWNADGTGKPLVLEGHQDRVYSAAFSPDGTRIVTASFDKTARVWNADGTGKPLVLAGHQDRVYSVAFSPDGTRIVTGSYDKTARVWNADGTGKPLVLEGHQARVSSVAFSADGTRIVTASLDKTVRVWNADWKNKPLVFEGHQDGISSAAFSPDGMRIVTASSDKTVQVWNADGTGKPLVLGHPALVSCAAFSADGTRIVTASWDKTARVWNADGTGKPLVFEGHRDRVYSAAFSPDGTRIATASLDKTARVWNADGTGKPLILEGHQDRVFSAGFSPDGTRIVTASQDKTARVWNADGTGTPLVLAGHRDRVFSAAFNPDGTRILTASGDKTARVWNADGTGTPLVFEGHTAAVVSGVLGGVGAFSPDSAQIVTISDDKTLRVWNADGTGEPAILRLPEIDPASAAFSPDGTRILTATHNAIDPATGKMKYWVTVWPRFQPITGLDDPQLWLATRYCPPVELRMELFGVSEEAAKEQLAACQARVTEAFARNSRRP